MTEKQKEKVIKSLKTAKLANSGQPLFVLARTSDSWSNEVSSFLQSLKRKGKVIYFNTTKVWYWKEEVRITDIIKL